MGGAVLVIAGLTLLEDALGRDFGIDELIFKDDTASLNPRLPGRMALATAFSFFSLGLSLLSLSSRRLPAGGVNANWPAGTFGWVSQSWNRTENSGAPVIHFVVMMYFMGRGLSPVCTQICQSTFAARKASWWHSTPCT